MAYAASNFTPPIQTGPSYQQITYPGQQPQTQSQIQPTNEEAPTKSKKSGLGWFIALFIILIIIIILLIVLRFVLNLSFFNRTPQQSPSPIAIPSCNPSTDYQMAGGQRDPNHSFGFTGNIILQPNQGSTCYSDKTTSGFNLCNSACYTEKVCENKNGQFTGKATYTSVINCSQQPSATPCLNSSLATTCQMCSSSQPAQYISDSNCVCASSAPQASNSPYYTFSPCTSYGMSEWIPTSGLDGLCPSISVSDSNCTCASTAQQAANDNQYDLTSCIAYQTSEFSPLPNSVLNGLCSSVPFTDPTCTCPSTAPQASSSSFYSSKCLSNNGPLLITPNPSSSVCPTYELQVITCID